MTNKLVGPLSDKFLVALGRVTANFGLLEGCIEFLTWSVIGRDQRLGQIITSELSFKGRVALLSSVFRHRVDDQQLIDKLEDLLSRAHQLEERRNVLVHSTWGAGDTADKATRFKNTAKKGKGIRWQNEMVTAKDVEATAEQASILAYEITDFHHNLPRDLAWRDETEQENS